MKATTKATTKAKTKKPAPKKKPASAFAAGIDAPGDWRRETLARMRALILDADPEIVETVKWRKPSNDMRGVPVWEKAGIVCTGETYKDKVKLTFPKGSALADPKGLFNAGLGGGVRRAIDIHEGGRVDEKAFRALIRAAVAHNGEQTAARALRKKAKPAR